VRHAQLSATVIGLGKILKRMIGCSLKYSKARARNLICCKSLISVLPRLIICNKLYCTLKINLKLVVGSLTSSLFIRNITIWSYALQRFKIKWKRYCIQIITEDIWNLAGYLAKECNILV
jgi:hypothetical protein